MCNEQGFPTVFTWTYSDKEIALEGSWDNWNTRKPLQRLGEEFTIMRVLLSGVYQYKFIVDGQWRILSLKTLKAFLANLHSPPEKRACISVCSQSV